MAEEQPDNVSFEASPDVALSTRSAGEVAVNKTCLACRRKHLKCDGDKPCSRCVASTSDCVYVASRRGRKGSRMPTSQSQQQPHTLSDLADTKLRTNDSRDLFHPVRSPVTASPDTSGPGMESLTPPLCDALSSFDRVGNEVPADLQVSDSDRYLTSFYHYVFGSHPFILPWTHLSRIAHDAAIRPLIATMRWAGSLYIPTRSGGREALYDEAHRLVHNPQTPRDGFLVQAMMILVVSLDGCDQRRKALKILSDAERLALEINLNTRLYATIHGRGIPVLEESWRRTWWDLYIIDSMMAGIHRVTNSKLFDVFADVALPCEEAEYTSGNIPPSLSLQDLQDRDFSHYELEFSSFAYRILCGQNLGEFMRMPATYGPKDESLKRVHALLTSWRLHLPRSKRDALQSDGKPDEMMFQAFMIMHATVILLHQPHSQLEIASTAAINSCASHQEFMPAEHFNAHTSHVIASACAISDMITYQTPLLAHTPFFTCVVTLSSIIHISRWALLLVSGDTGEEDVRQRIRLNLGALKRLSTVWEAATKARGQVASVAKDIFSSKKRNWIDWDSSLWEVMTQEDALEKIVSDDLSMDNSMAFQLNPH